MAAVRRAPTIIVATAVAALLVSCSSGGETGAITQPGGASAETDVVELERQVEEQTAACMRSQGFEYQLDAAAVAARVAQVNDLAGAEYAATHGFGVSTTATSTETDGGSEAAISADANAEYLASLGPDAIDAWNVALYGDPSGGEAGCYDRAINDVLGASAASDIDPAELADAAVRAEADPDMIRLHRDWSECMNDSGFQYEKLVDAYLDIEDRLAALGEPAGVTPELEELQEYERTVAVAAFECTNGLESTYDEIVDRYLANGS